MSKIFPSSVRQAVSKVTPDVQILWIHNLIEKQHGMLEQATRNRKLRQHWLAQIAEMNEHGAIALCVWSRDCDMCEGTSRYETEAVSWVIEEPPKQIVIIKGVT